MRRFGGIAVAASLLCWPGTSQAQTVEVAPFVGYRFGGDFFERVTGQPVDLDGARAVGGMVNVKFMHPGLFAEALFTHQEARFTVPGGLFAPPSGLADHGRSLSGRRTAGVREQPAYAPVSDRPAGAHAVRGRGRQRDPVRRQRRRRREADARATHRRPARRTGVRDVRGCRRASDCLHRSASASSSSTPTWCGRQSSAPGSLWRFLDGPWSIGPVLALITNAGAIAFGETSP